jgi:hypothetical protein
MVRSDDAETFWNWLGANTARIQKSIKQKTPGIWEEVSEQFESAYPELFWETTIPQEDEAWVFCVSADGDRDLFPRVQEVVNRAPQVPGWTIQAFRTRGVPDVEISMDGQTLDAKNVWCEVERVPEGVNLVLHLSDVTEETEETLTQAALVLLDNAVGEYDAVMKIANVDFALMEGKPKERDNFFPLPKLPEYLDGLA